MKKTLIALMCVFGCTIAMATDNVVTNVYDFRASLRMPHLNKGVRLYQTHSFKGYLYSETTNGKMTAMWLESQNNKTKVIHLTEFGDGFYNLMGKNNKTSERTVPTVYFEAADVENAICCGGETHEFITKIQFAGLGSLKTLKTVTKGCTSCGVPSSSTEYCNILWKMSGSCTGVVDCQCPDDEEWNHTLETTLCGVYHDDDGNVERSHFAATWGTWSATFNKKLSDTIVK